MPLAKNYSPNPQAQKNQDVGPNPYEQMSASFSKMAVNPQLTVFKYTVLPVAKNFPVFGKVVKFFEYFTDPIGELKKDLEISPSIGSAIKESIISNSVAGVAKVLAVSSGLAAGGELSSSLVHNAIACEAARTATLAARNPVKFAIQGVWENLIKGDILDNFIYDKKYIFWYDETGKAARWKANVLAETFNKYGSKHGARIEGPELKFGSQAYTKVNVDKAHGLVPFLKFGKVGWQVFGPTVASALIAPPIAPIVFAWQVLNADWKQFIVKNPVVETPDRRLAGFRKGVKNQQLRKDAFGLYITESSGRSYRWWEINDISDRKIRIPNKIFKTLDDFFTFRGLYRTFVTGETLWERGWKIRGDYADQPLHFVNRPGQVGVGRDLKMFDARRFELSDDTLHLPDGRVIKNLGYNNRAKEIVGTNKLARGLYHFQQFTSKIAAPVALVFLIPNPVTIPLAIFMVARNIGSVVAPLKLLGWQTVERNQMQLIAKYGAAAAKAGKKFISIATPVALVWESKGTTFFRRLIRRVYSILSPFDRDVGFLSGLMIWRDAQWDKALRSWSGSRTGKATIAFLAAHPWIGKVVNFIRNIPGMHYLFKAGGFLLGGIKWIVAPGQAIKDALWDFGKWVAWKGIRWAVGNAFRTWIRKPLVNWLQSQIIKLPAGSLRRKFFEFFLRRSVGRLPLPKVPTGFFGKFLRPIFNAIKDLLGRFINNFVRKIIEKLIRFIWNLILEVAKTIINVINQGLQAIFGTATAPVWGTILLIGLGILAVLALIGLILLVIIILFMAFTTIANPNPKPAPVSDYMEIRKEVANPKSNGVLFTAGETIQYRITYQIKKKLNDPVSFEDNFLIKTTDSGNNSKYFFDSGSLDCQSPANSTAISVNPDPEGPAGDWRGVLGTVPNNDPTSSGPQTVEFICTAKIDSRYTDGDLINHVILKATESINNKEVSVSQFLYVNGGNASGWPVEHGCFTQGPNGVFTHLNQQAVDIGSNPGLGFNIASKPVHATIAGKVLRVCVDGTYTASETSGVCGGIDENSHFGTGFGTYVILKENNTRLSVFYAHLSEPATGLVEGAPINKGEILGYVDSTGNSFGSHLHYAFTRASGATMNQPFIPYYVPQCSNTDPDPTCADAFASIGEPSRVCF